MSQIGIIAATDVVQTLTGDAGGAVPPTAGNINVVGAGGISTTGNPGTSTLTITAGAAIATTYTTDAGVATPAANNLDVLGGANINTAGAADILTVSLNDSIDLPDTNALGTQGVYYFNSIRFMHNYGVGNNNAFIGLLAGNFTNTTSNLVGVGTMALESVTTGSYSTAVGYSALSVCTTGSANSVFGGGAADAITTGSQNCIIGALAGLALTTEDDNTIVGAGAAQTMTGASNIIIGFTAGSAYTNAGATDDNIIIGSAGIDGDNGLIRIGTNGTHTETHITGIYNVATGATSGVVLCDNADKLGATNGANGQVLIGGGTAPAWANITSSDGSITITNGANTIDLTILSAYTLVNNAASPYTVLTTDYYLAADVTAGAVTIQLPNAPSTGRTFIVKDKVGLAATNNVTVTTVGGAVTLDGSTSFVMNTAYEAAQFIFNGTSYEIF